jgi:hypothetical protein
LVSSPRNIAVPVWVGTMILRVMGTMPESMA